MQFPNWLRFFRHGVDSPRRGRKRAPATRRLGLEVLEARAVPAITAVNDAFTAALTTPTNLNVLANDTNPTGGLQVVSATPLSPSGPTLTQNADGTFSFTSAATGTFAFNYTAGGKAQAVTAADGAAGDGFGVSVAVSGDTAVVGASGHKVGSNYNQGSAYVFVRSGTTWSQQQELTAADGAASDNFGSSVAVSGDTIVVGAHGHQVGSNNAQGSAYVYVRYGTTWSRPQELIADDGAANDLFGLSVAISGDTIVVGANSHKVGSNYNQGSAYVFVLGGTDWIPQQELTAADGAVLDDFGQSVAVSGDTAVVGADGHSLGGNGRQGSAYVYVRSGTTWSQQQNLTAADGAAGDSFGISVAVSGDTAVVGAQDHKVGPNGDGGQGSAYVYVRSGTTWSQQQELTNGDGSAFEYFGSSVAVSGDTTVVGAGGHNVAYVQNWTQATASVTVFVNPPAEIVVTSGDRQVATVNTAFANPLLVTVTDVYNVPVPGVTVTFVAPGSNAGVTFSGGNTATTNAQGVASKSVTANSTAGAYNVTASVSHVTIPATFALTINAAVPNNPAVVAFSAATYSFKEGSTATLTLTRTGDTSCTVTVAYAVSQPTGLAAKYLATPNVDYTGAASGTVTFNAGAATQTLTFTLPNLNLVEENTQFLVTLSQPTGGATLASPAATTVTIVDTNLPSVPGTTPKLPTLQKAGIGFGTSDEHYQQFVRSAYDHYLRRTPSDAEVKSWVDLMKTYQNDHTQGLKQEQIEAGFIDSKEYIGRFGSVGKAWIDGIYADLLSRAPDSSGESYWVGQLGKGVDPTLVALGFTTSLERLQNRVSATYLTLLERPADAGGLAYWVNVFNTGGTTEDINSGFVGSVEYYNKANGAAGNPARWVREAYLDVLFRAAAVDELKYWQNFLNA